MKRTSFFITIVVLAALIASASSSVAQGPGPQPPQSPQALVGTAASALLSTSFTYQGQLKNASGPVTGVCDMAFQLHGDASADAPVGSAITPTVPITNGLFTVQLDFGASAFTGEARWLQIAVKCGSDAGYTSLAPRQALTAAPYALHSHSTGALQGSPITTTAPVISQVLKWNGSTWVPAADTDTTYTAGDGLELDGAQFKAKGTPYQNVVIVAKSGGDFTSVQAALDSITAASDANRYLVWVAPGIYTETVTMKQYVDIEGAGELLTTLSYPGSASSNTGTVVGASNAELRFLTVRNTGGDTCAIAIYNSSASPRLTHVTASASGGTQSYGVINSSFSSPAMTNVTASASGGVDSHGVVNFSSSPAMTNVTTSASGGTSSNFGVYNILSSPTMNYVTTSASGGTTSYGVYNNSSSSPTMNYVTTSASGGTDNYGVVNTSSSPTMNYVTASASGGTTSYGVYNNSSSSPTMNYVTTSASGGTTSYGVYNNFSSPTIQNSTLCASGGTSVNYGIFNSASTGVYTVTVSNSQVTGSSATISNDTEFTVRVGASQLAGGSVTGGGTVTCFGVYDENYTNPDYAKCP